MDSNSVTLITANTVGKGWDTLILSHIFFHFSLYMFSCFIGLEGDLLLFTVHKDR